MFHLKRGCFEWKIICFFKFKTILGPVAQVTGLIAALDPSGGVWENSVVVLHYCFRLADLQVLCRLHLQEQASMPFRKTLEAYSDYI